MTTAPDLNVEDLSEIVRSIKKREENFIELEYILHHARSADQITRYQKRVIEEISEEENQRENKEKDLMTKYKHFQSSTAQDLK
jgi:hypothetical protein